MEPTIIVTAEQHRQFLAEAELLAADDPRLGSAAGDRLALLAKLVEDYEKVHFAFDRSE